MSGLVDAMLVSPHPLFDPQWYRETNVDIPGHLATFGHYLSGGWRKLKSPHPLFSVEYYLRERSDVRMAGVEPLGHFIKQGWKDQSNPHPLFDVAFYLSQCPELGGNDPLTHYLSTGWKQGYRPNNIFDPTWYLSSNTDVKLTGQEPLTHYLRVGWREGRRVSPSFDSEAYRQCHGLSSEINPFIDRVLRKRQRVFAPTTNSMDVRDWQTEVTLNASPEVTIRRAIGVFVHLFYDGVADEIASYLAQITFPKKVYVTTDTNEKKIWIAKTFEWYSIDVEITVVPNLGFDIAPFLFGFPEQIQEHDICLKIHGKKSSHNPPEFSEGWRNHLYSALVGDPERVGAIINAFVANPELGLLIPEYWIELAGWLGIGENSEPMTRLLGKVGIDLIPDQEIEYPSGSMFWFKPEALSSLFDLGLHWSDFAERPDQRDGTLSHAVERCFLFFCALSNHKWAFLPAGTSPIELSKDETMRLIKESGEFDEVYYLKTYDDVAKAGNDPLEHWVVTGFREGRNPSATFDTSYYYRWMPSNSWGRLNPLVHYLLEGRAQDLPRMPRDRVPALIAVDNVYSAYVRVETQRDYIGETAPIVRGSDIKLIAFYLPQFHPFAENDKFWGKGFTEWTNTTKSLPLFKGQYQPRLPGELGFYDTRLKQVLAKQIELAKQFGIHGFCLHHYFFDGKPVMRAPYDLLLANPDLDIPFCLHWANEPWTVRFDGLSTSKGVLLDQRHSPEDDLAFFRDIEPALRDRRYIKIDGRPVLIVYRPSLFPDIRGTLDRWRKCCHRTGIKDPYLVTMQTGFEGSVDPTQYGFDAAVEFPPNNFHMSNVSRRVQFYDRGAEVGIYDYEHAVDKALALPEPNYRLFRGIMPDWDCTPRRANPGVFINCAPHRYQRWLEAICAKTDNDSTRSHDEKLIFINAWNEWAEGAYLEPDRKHGYAYLDATARALNKQRSASIDSLNLRILVAAHIFYTDLLDEFIEHFRMIPGRFDLLITAPREKRDHILRYVRERMTTVGKITVLSVENIGADVAPFLLHMLPHAHDYDICCKVHSKKTPYNSKFAGWRQFLLGNLLGSPQNIAAIVEAFANDAKLGLVYAKPFAPVANHVEWGSNFELTASLLKRLGITINSDETPQFPTGTMFWFRPKALAPLLTLGLTLDDFARAAGQGSRDPDSGAIVDGTLMHALERMISYVTKAAGFALREVLFEH